MELLCLLTTIFFKHLFLPRLLGTIKLHRIRYVQLFSDKIPSEAHKPWADLKKVTFIAAAQLFDDCK